MSFPQIACPKHPGSALLLGGVQPFCGLPGSSLWSTLPLILHLYSYHLFYSHTRTFVFITFYRERKGEKHQCERETLIGIFLYLPGPGILPVWILHGCTGCTWTGDQPATQESNQQHFSYGMVIQPTEPHQTGLITFLKDQIKTLTISLSPLTPHFLVQLYSEIFGFVFQIILCQSHISVLIFRTPRTCCILMRKKCFSTWCLLRTRRTCQNFYKSRCCPARENASSLVA